MIAHIPVIRRFPNILLTSCIAWLGLLLGRAETLAPLQDGKVPENVEELWAGFDPRKEPLDVEVLKEWEQEGIVMKVLRYRIGVFKGSKTMMAAVYGYPKGGVKLPGLVQIHGGGQYAHSNAVFTNARRGYATISISWAGRIDAPDYKVNPDGVKLFWEGKTDDPKYKLTTDWGLLDAYHAPSRNPKNQFPSIPQPGSWTLDEVISPRNNSWFLCTLGARRALTFLEQQPEVDAGKLGVYGHSMGGKLTVLTAGSDDRIKAAAPSCGGVSDRFNDDPLFRATLGDDAYLKKITCPTIFLSPSNDFHGRIDDLQIAAGELQTKDWRFVCSPHHKHQDTAPYEVATQIWFDQWLKGSFEVPHTPQAKLELKATDGVPVFHVKPDTTKPVLAVDVYYTQQGRPKPQKFGENDDRDNTVSRFWRHATATRNGDNWVVKLPLFDTDHPLWVYANVLYPLDPPITAAGYYYRDFTTDSFYLSSRMSVANAADLKSAGVGPALPPSLLLESFDDGWEKEWFSYRPDDWPRSTHKLYDPQFAAPAGARLALEVRADKPNQLVIGIDESAAEITLNGGGEWQEVIMETSDFKNATGQEIKDWKDILELRLGHQETLKSKDASLKLGAKWNGADPEFRNLHWIAPKPIQ